VYRLSGDIWVYFSRSDDLDSLLVGTGHRVARSSQRDRPIQSSLAHDSAIDPHPARILRAAAAQGVRDRDGGIWLMAALFGQFPFLVKLFADSAYAGSIFYTALGKVLPNLKT
jgi:hypothetical protein